LDKEKETPELYELWEFKKRSGWTHDKIANYMGVNMQSIVNWVTGAFKPSSRSCVKIKKFLDNYFII